MAQSQAAFKAGLPFNMDAWDGYPPARERLYAMLRKIGANPLAFAGDSHAAWANLPGLGKIIAAQSPEVAFCDQDAKGYTMVTITPDAAVADFVTVSTVYTPQFTRGVAARYEARKGFALKAIL